jgi:hypothetical protein
MVEQTDNGESSAITDSNEIDKDADIELKEVSSHNEADKIIKEKAIINNTTADKSHHVTDIKYIYSPSVTLQNQ